jgi:Smg protein
MFEILVYLFENYYTPQACPEADVLAHKLAAVGFEHEDINDALGWLHGLAQTTEQCVPLSLQPQRNSLRVFTDSEYQILGKEAIGFITFLENSDVLPPALREILIDRALATDESPVSLGKIKIIALMVLWSQQAEVDHLVFEELLTDERTRLYH